MTLADPSVGMTVLPGGDASIVAQRAESDECFRKIESWLQKCLTEHQHCRPVDCTPGFGGSRPKSPLPKRLLWLGAHNDDICLHETINQTGTYLALSHCWGKSQHLLLTKALLEAMKSHIPWNQLPKTFQDAIVVARKLSVQYLWVDSLCII